MEKTWKISIGKENIKRDKASGKKKDGKVNRQRGTHQKVLKHINRGNN